MAKQKITIPLQTKDPIIHKASIIYRGHVHANNFLLAKLNVTRRFDGTNTGLFRKPLKIIFNNNNKGASTGIQTKNI